MFTVFAILLITTTTSISAIIWNVDAIGVYYASNCDFNGNNMYSIEVPANECGPLCATTSGCTHFAWSRARGGLCWLKEGSISRRFAKSIGTDSVCGVVPEK